MAVQISGNDITVPRDGSFTRNVTIGGTLTYEDVTNIDSVGLVTARSGLEIGARPGVAASISVDGNMVVSGISTFGGAGSFGGAVTISHATPQFISIDTDGSNDYSTFQNSSGQSVYNAVDNNTHGKHLFQTAGTERMRIDSSGRLLIGLTESSTTDSNAHSKLQVVSSAGPNIAFGNNSSDIDDDDRLGVINFSSNHGGSYHEVITIRGAADADHASNSKASRLELYTTPTGATQGTERLRITSEGKQYIIGANSGGFNATTLPNGNTLNINTKTSNDGLSVIRYSGSYAAYAVNIGRSKNDTIGTNSIVADGDDLGHITWYGADGSDFNQAAAISVQVDGSPSDGTDMPAALIFKTTAEGSGTPTERLRLNSVGSAVFANGIQIGVDEGSSSSGGLLIHRYSSTSIDDGTDFDVTITWPHSNTGAFMVECFSGHSHYRGSISYYKVVGMYGASSASTGGVDMTTVQETNTNTVSFSDTSNATQRGNGSDYSVTITGRSGQSNVGTSIDGHVHVYVHSRIAPTSVTIG